MLLSSPRPCGPRAVLKFAQYTGAHAIAGKHTPGTFSNHIQTSFNEPRLLILTDPRTDHQPIKESALGNIPTIAFCDTDSPMGYVDIGIPANNKEKHSIGCLFWLLARMVLQMRGTFPQVHNWDIMVGLFFYIEPEEAKQQEEEEAVPVADYALLLIMGSLFLNGVTKLLMVSGLLMQCNRLSLCSGCPLLPRARWFLNRMASCSSTAIYSSSCCNWLG